MPSDNNDKRRKAFWNFFLLFLLCVAVITVTIFASIQVPLKQNDDNLKKLAKIDKDHAYIDEFMKQMSFVQSKVDSIGMGPEAVYLEAKIPDWINELISLGSKDSIYKYDLYQNVGKLFYKFLDLKKTLKGQTRKNGETDDFQKRIDDLNIELNKYKDSVANIQMILRNKGIKI